MANRLAKCGRCGNIFVRNNAPVCENCLSAEEGDYRKIRDVIAGRDDLPAEAIAEQAGVTAECVQRMVGDGRLSNLALSGDVRCGQCNAPAVSVGMRLCESCLAKLKRDWQKATNDMRQRLSTIRRGYSVHETHRTVLRKRTGEYDNP